ncbi:hypothetical protein JCM19992_30310 [Thermostilla marina]
MPIGWMPQSRLHIDRRWVWMIALVWCVLYIGLMLGSYWADPQVRSPGVMVAAALVWLAGMSGIIFFGYRFSSHGMFATCPVHQTECGLPYRLLLESAKTGMMGYDANGRITFINRWSEEMIGYGEHELVGRSIFDIVWPEDRDKVKQGFCEWRSGKGRTCELRVRRKDGSYLWILTTASPLLSSSGQFRGAIVMMTDISAQKRVESELREHAKALEEANSQLKELHERAAAASRVKGEFLANVSHEIRTPLTAILGYAETLLIEGDISKAPPSRVQAIQVIMRNGRYLLRIVNDILDLSKMEAGRLDVEQTQCSPLGVVSDVVRLMQGKADAKGLTFRTEFRTHIPRAIHSDPIRLRQILINLVGNAIKFTESGSVRIVLSCDEGSIPPTLKFEIIDTGVGIPSDKLETIFDPFCQADTSARRRFGGTGLGLSISQRLASRMGGSITVVSEEGLGSNFQLTLPIRVASGEIEWIENPAATLNTLLANVRGELPESRNIPLKGRILLAEDALDNQRLIAHILRKAGAEVETVANGRDAVKQALRAAREGDPFDVILMDMQMPLMDGYEATRQLRQAGYTSPIIALTAHAMAGEREKCIAAGCDEYATKPIDRVTLLNLVRKYAVDISTCEKIAVDGSMADG